MDCTCRTSERPPIKGHWQSGLGRPRNLDGGALPVESPSRMEQTSSHLRLFYESSHQRAPDESNPTWNSRNSDTPSQTLGSSTGETVPHDLLSHGQFMLGVGLGTEESYDYERFGERTDTGSEKDSALESRFVFQKRIFRNDALWSSTDHLQ